jgi:hypothetical protein
MRAHAVRDADTRYYYVYGDPTFGFSAEASFVSEPHPGQSDRVINLFAFGDMGKTTQVHNTIMTHTTHDTTTHTPHTHHTHTTHTTHIKKVINGERCVAGQLDGALEQRAGVHQHDDPHR